MKQTVKEWENEVNYGNHMICKCCAFAIFEYVPHSKYIQDIQCSEKKRAVGSGAVKPMSSCMNWNPRLFEPEDLKSGKLKSVPFQDILAGA